MKNNLKVILFYVVFIALIAVVVVFLFGGSGNKQQITDVEDYQEVIKVFADTADKDGDGIADAGVRIDNALANIKRHDVARAIYIHNKRHCKPINALV